MQKNKRCNCEYCIKFIEPMERELVKPGEQCKAGFRWDLTGEKKDAANAGREELFKISLNDNFSNVNRF